MITEFSHMFRSASVYAGRSRNRVGRRRKKGKFSICHKTQLGQDRFKATAITGTAGALPFWGPPDDRVVILKKNVPWHSVT